MKNLFPDPILKHGRALWEACALIAGIRLGVFKALASRPLAVAGLARKCRSSVRGMKALADALAAHGYLGFRRGRYLNTPLSRRYLLPGGEAYLGDILLHQARLLESWSSLDKSVKSGRPVRRRPHTAESASAFARAMASMAGLTAPIIAEMLRFNGARTLLDLGGGPGLHSLHFCRRNPELRATVMDSAETLRETRRILLPRPEFARIRLRPGDVLKDPLPGPADIVWMSHLIHSMSPAEVRRLLGKTADALPPGGRLIIHDFFTYEDRPGPPYPSLFRLNMFSGTPAGRTYSRGELRRWLSQLGFDRFKFMDVPRSPSGLLTAVRTAGGAGFPRARPPAPRFAHPQKFFGKNF